MKQKILLAIIAISSLTFSGCIPPGGGGNTTIAKAIYLFNGNASDGSGHAKHGTVHGATLTSDRFGNENKAYHFDESMTQYIELPTYSSILGTSDEISISFWCKFDNIDRGPTPVSLYPDDASDRLSISVPYHPTANPADIYWDYGDLFSTGRLHQTVTTDVAWHHYVCIKSATDNVMEIYRDGALFASKSGYDNLNNKDRNFHIGGSDGLGWFVGSIDDVKIYAKRLTQTEITKLFNNQTV